MRGTTRITDAIHPSLFCDKGAVHFTPGLQKGVFCGSFHRVCLAFEENDMPSLHPINARLFYSFFTVVSIKINGYHVQNVVMINCETYVHAGVPEAVDT